MAKSSGRSAGAPPALAAKALDATLVSIKIVATRPEEAAEPPSPLRTRGSPAAAAATHNAPRPLQPQAHDRRQQQRHAPSSLECALRSLVALAPNTIFACVSGALGLLGACTAALLALLVLAAACVAQFFHEMALMLVMTDLAVLEFTTGEATAAPAASNNKKNKKQKNAATDPGRALVSAALSLLSLSCDLLAIGFFKGTVGLSYCCSLYGALAIPALAWTAGGDSATALVPSHSFAEAPVQFALVHGGLWVFALLWLAVTGAMSQRCSQNLRVRR